MNGYMNGNTNYQGAPNNFFGTPGFGQYQYQQPFQQTNQQPFQRQFPQQYPNQYYPQQQYQTQGFQPQYDQYQQQFPQQQQQQQQQQYNNYNNNYNLPDLYETKPPPDINNHKHPPARGKPPVHKQSNRGAISDDDLYVEPKKSQNNPQKTNQVVKPIQLPKQRPPNINLPINNKNNNKKNKNIESPTPKKNKSPKLLPSPSPRRGRDGRSLNDHRLAFGHALPKPQPLQKKPIDNLIKTPLDLLYFSKKARPVDFVPHTLDEYKALRPGEYVELGKLGPNLKDHEYLEKKEKLERQMNYGKSVELENRNRLKAKLPEVPQKEPSKREIANQFAKNIPKPVVKERIRGYDDSDYDSDYSDDSDERYRDNNYEDVSQSNSIYLLQKRHDDLSDQIDQLVKDYE